MKRLIKKSRIPCERDFYYNPWDYDFIDIGLQTVNVNDIVGMSSGRNDEYNDDWTPKNPEDDRWLYQKDLIESGNEMEPIPLIQLPNKQYISDGDGNHRISVAKVLGLDVIQAIVSVMVPSEDGVNEAWEQHAKENIDKLNELSKQYKDMLQKLPKLQDDAYDNGKFKEYNEFKNSMNIISDEISELDMQLTSEEKEFKRNMIK